jgi:hypothetical protein
VSPSKRAGDTVDSDRDPSSATGAAGNGSGNGNGDGHAGNGDGPAPTARAKPRRRSIVSPASAPVPERGTSSTRGASSSSITKRSMTGRPDGVSLDERPPAVISEPLVEATIEPDVSEGAKPAEPDEPGGQVLLAEPVIEEPALASPIAMPPPGARVDPDARRPHTGEHTVLPAPVPVTLPAGPAVTAPAERSATEVDQLGVPTAPPEAPYVSSTMTTHQVAPVPRLLGRRPRVRRVTRVVRHVDPWSVFKIAIVFNLVLYIVLLTAGVLLWNVAYATGTVDNLERFFESFGWSTFEFHGGAIFHASWIAGLFGVIGLTGVAVLAATLFNLITDLVGGVRLTVLEEEVQERTMAPMRRFVVRRPTSPHGGDPSTGLRREVDRLPDPDLPDGQPLES